MYCPICHQEFDRSQSPAKPFCSERCRLIDLGRWLGEAYAMPGEPTAATEDEFENLAEQN